MRQLRKLRRGGESRLILKVGLDHPPVPKIYPSPPWARTLLAEKSALHFLSPSQGGGWGLHERFLLASSSQPCPGPKLRLGNLSSSGWNKGGGGDPFPPGRVMDVPTAPEEPGGT